MTNFALVLPQLNHCLKLTDIVSSFKIDNDKSDLPPCCFEGIFVLHTIYNTSKSVGTLQLRTVLKQ